MGLTFCIMTCPTRGEHLWAFFSPFSGEFSSILEFLLFVFCDFSLLKFILDSLSSSFRLFFVGISRFVDNNLGPPPLEGYVSGDSVLHRLAAELYSIVYPAISIWGVVRDIMAANETKWPLSLFDELPEGLSSPKSRERFHLRRRLVRWGLVLFRG